MNGINRNNDSFGRDMDTTPEYLIGVDGGGTGTRVRIERPDGTPVGYGTGGPSGLMHGAEKAWNAILQAMEKAFADADLAFPPLRRVAAGFGLAGVNNRQWAAEFAAQNPGFGAVAIETDAFTTLLGAHRGKPGAIIAIGTGSVGEVWLPDGTRREVGGWGFPSSDEASGAWLGLHAINYVQRVLDGREAESDFARALIDACGGDRHGVHAWLAQANQTVYAQLAPIVVAHAASDDVARRLMSEAGKEAEKLADALDPSGTLPIALCGGIAEALRPYLRGRLLERVVAPHADSAAGALLLIRRTLEEAR